MRVYAKVLPSFWTGHQARMLRGLGSEAFEIALYLHTCPDANMLGLYYLALPTMVHHTGISTKGACKTLEILSGVGFAHYDHDAELVWVPEMAAQQVDFELKERDKRIFGIRKAIKPYMQSRFYPNFWERYNEAFRLELPRPSEGAYMSLPSNKKEKEKEKESLRLLPDSLNPPEDSESRRSWTDRPQKPPEDLDWRISLVWEAHLKARVKFFERVNGAAPQNPPTLTPDLRKGIRAAILEHDGELLGTEKRDAFRRDSRARAAGIGIFYDPFLTGSSTENDIRNGGKRYLEPERCWVPQRGKPNPVSRFAELYFEQRAAWELAQGVPVPGATQEAMT